ncbi:hypothetical protein G9A89_020599 [Geosiphon pyriformis]|nr:hypothetical protein G9A89_020599 [Geosiphon pyriformis]
MLRKNWKNTKHLYCQRFSFFLFPSSLLSLVISFNVPYFVVIELVGSFAGGSGTGLAGLRFWSGSKKKARVESVYARDPSYKKSKKLIATGIVVDSSAGFIPENVLQMDCGECKVSWDSKVKSKDASISGMSDIKNINNMVAEETSYVDSNASETDNMVDDIMSRKTQIKTYVLRPLPKTPSFRNLSNNDTELVLPKPKFAGSNWLLSANLRVSESHSFEPIRLFALDVDLAAVPEKTNGNKLMAVKKIFYQINGFGGALTPSKFSGIIRSSFMSELSLKKARELAIHKKIVVNNDVRQVNKHINWVIVVKEILVDLSKLAVESVFSKFGKIVSIKMQLIDLWQKALVKYKSSEVVNSVVSKWLVFMGKDFHRALFYTLPIGITAYNLPGLLESYDGKTCFIGHNPSSYVRNRCAVVCFENKTSKLAAIGSIPVYKGVNLYWTGLFLACCTKCKQFGHIFDVCLVGGDSGICENDKTWAQVVGGSSSLLGSSSPLSAGLFPDVKPSIGVWSSFSSANLHGVSSLFNCLASLEWSLELLTNQVSNIVRKLSFVELVPLLSVFCKLFLAVSTILAPKVISNMILDDAPEPSALPFFAVVDDTSGFSLSSSKILTTKMGGLESKMTFLEASITTCNVRDINVPAKQVDVVCWHISFGNTDKYDGVQIFTSGLDVGHLSADVTVVINNSLACHVSKVKVVLGWIILVCLLFKGKLSVSVLSLYAGVSAGVHFGQAPEVNSIIAKAVNTSTFMVLGGDFNESRSGRSASFKFCSNAERTIDYIFISESLFSAVAKHWVSFVSDFFDTNHNTVVVSVSLDGLLDFKIKDADSAEWSHFRDCFSVRILMIKDRFLATTAGHNLDAMLWFSNFQCSRNKQSSKFLELELLVAKIVKRLESGDAFRFDCFVKKWSTLDADKTLVLRNMVYADHKIMDILKYLSTIRKRYRKFKMYESKLAQEASIRAAIEKYMEKFGLDKNSMIRSVLNRLFWKVVLDHLVVDDELVLDPDGIRLNVDRIMEGWTRKCVVPSALSDFWAHQYVPLDYIRDNAFSGVMDAIGMSKLFVVVGGLPDGKATGFMMECFLVLLNECLFISMMPALWKRAWVLMIPKPYDWDRIFTNTCPIALIKTARKILFDQISFACSKFSVLHGDNFLVLKGTSTQVLVFAVGSVVEDALEKNKELWLVLQDMHKVYDFVGWHHLKTSLRCIKMCGRFIKFFGSIYEDRINRVMTNFGLSNGYRVHDGLDQGERIFYDLLLCEVKRHEHLCEYQINTKFVAKSGRVESDDRMFSFFVAGAFVDDTIWYALNIASNFFSINDISINSEKTVAIPINQSVKVASLNINGQPISIAKRGKAHKYLGIFLLTKGLSRPNLVKAHLDVCFFANVVLRKTITDKQFSYLVSAVLQPIVNYRTQFSFVSLNVCHKWDVLVKKGLKLKAGLLHNFPDAALHHPSLYGLKSFKQIQAESKLVAVVMFSNALGILGHLFDHRFLDLQILNWAPLNSLQFSVKIHISPVNNFLAGVVKIFLGNELSLANNLLCAFHNPGNFSMSLVLRSASYFGSVHFLKWFGVAFGDKLLDKKGHVINWKTFCQRLVSHWFNFTSGFLCDGGALSSGLARVNQFSGLDILASEEFSDLHNGLLKDFGSSNVAGSAAAYFSAINYSISVKIHGLISSILAKLQAVALVLECVPSSSAMTVHLDSQAAIDTYVSELSYLVPDFQVLCWVERHYIFNLIREKNLSISWVKVKDYSGVYGNIKADTTAGIAICSQFSLPIRIQKWLLITESMVVSGNACYFVRNLFRSVCQACWEAGPGCDVIQSSLFECLYLMKAVHHQLFMAKVELPDHVFSCAIDAGVQEEILAKATTSWVFLVSSCVSFSSAVLQFLGHCSLDVGLYLVLCKGFVMSNWCSEAVGVFEVKKVAVGVVVNFVRSIVKLYHKKAGSVGDDGVISGLSHCKISVLSNGVIQMLGVLGFFSVSFGYCKPKLFFSGLDFNPRVVVCV